MEFSELKSQTEFWLLDLPTGISTRVGGFVNEAIRKAEERHNFRCMEEELLPVTVNQQRELVSNKDSIIRWKESRGKPYYYRQDGTTVEIDWAPSESEMIRTFAIQLPDEGNTTPADEGPPRYLLERDTTIDVFPLPDDESDWDNGLYRVVVPFWGYLDDLSGDNDTNWFTNNSPYYIIWKACELGFMANRDEERADYFAGKAEPLFKEMRRADKLSRLGDRLTLARTNDVYSGRTRDGEYRQG